MERLCKSRDATIHSLNVISSWGRKFNQYSDIDIANLHWVGREMMSIEDIGRVQKPVVWTLYDMWAFCGTEYYTSDDQGMDWRTGRIRSKKLRSEIDLLGRWVWRRKKNHGKFQ